MRIYVIQQPVPYSDSISGRFCDRRPYVELLGNGIEPIVVAIERIEGTKHRPPGAKRFCCVGTEPAHIGTDHRDLEEGGKFKDVGDADAVVVPYGEIVAKPFADVAAGSCELWCAVSMSILSRA